MKKITICLLATFFALTINPMQSKAATSSETSNTEATQSAEAKTLLLRLDDINAMDKSNLTLSDKKDLRAEVTQINYRLRESGGGVYLSVGALIIIILLLIILF
jgi:hypothetical protein